MKPANLWVGNCYRCVKSGLPELEGSVVRVREQRFVYRKDLPPGYLSTFTSWEMLYPAGLVLTHTTNYLHSDEFEELSKEEEMVYEVSSGTK